MAALADAEARRTELCRLTPERALETLDEAEAWLRERGVVTLRPDCSLPSLHFAMHEEPYAPGQGGFAEWPKTRWWWGHALDQQPGIHFLKLRRGKGVFLTDATAALADPLARAELARADEGAHGEEARRLVAHLAEAGPSFTEEIREELSLDGRALRALRGRLERCGVLVADTRVIEGSDRYATELARWDQRFSPAAAGGAAELATAGLRAAVIAPEAEARRWFTWEPPPAWAAGLIEDGGVARLGDHLVWLGP